MCINNLYKMRYDRVITYSNNNVGYIFITIPHSRTCLAVKTCHSEHLKYLILREI